jgi:NitT/TauT family transport system substrate-binding protein
VTSTPQAARRERGCTTAVRQGIELKIVADKGSSLPGHGYFAFVVRKELADKIKEPADMRGRLLAVTGYGAGAPSESRSTSCWNPAASRKARSTRSIMQFADIAAALGTGKVDIGVLIEPLVSQVVNKGIAVVWKRVDTVYPISSMAR